MNFNLFMTRLIRNMALYIIVTVHIIYEGANMQGTYAC